MQLNFRIIGRRIKEIRLQKQITQEVLAEWIDVSPTYISHIERAKKRVSLEALVKISGAFEITVDQLLNGNQESDPAEYKSELAQLIVDCNSYEKRIIYEIALAAKNSLRNNKELSHKMNL